MSGPKILLFDIETAPILGNVWQLFKQNVGLNQIQRDWYMLSWAAKWLGESEVMYQDVRNDVHSDADILPKLWELLDEADWVVTHNGNRFDIPKIKVRFLLNGFPPFSPVRSIDTCSIAKRVFGFTSNKLEYLSDKLCPEEKKLTHCKFPGFDLWSECLRGNHEAWDEMRLYNKQDVRALEGVYLALRPWATTHPNFALYIDDLDKPACPKCGGKVIKKGKEYTNQGTYQRFKCKECGSNSRSRTMVTSQEERKHIIANAV